MSEFAPEPIVTRLFYRLRKRGFNLGMSEYLAALEAVKGGFAVDRDDLFLMLQPLWCHSLGEQSQFLLIWQEVTAQFSETSRSSEKAEPSKIPPPAADLLPPEPPAPQPHSAPSGTEPSNPELATLPVRTPFVPAEVNDLPELQTYHPVSRRSMSYTWRYLRRPVALGAADLLDVEATVEQAARQGFFLAPVYRRREINQARLLLLVDQDGSMTPFHRFTRDLVETALMPGVFPEDQVQVFYFYNFPTEYVYRDDRLTLPERLDAALAGCDSETSVMIISDAGAARGYRRLERIRQTAEFLTQVKRKTGLISWLNPMPQNRWRGSSAEVIAYLVPMGQMDNDGLSNAIDIVRGQPLSHLEL